MDAFFTWERKPRTYGVQGGFLQEGFCRGREPIGVEIDGWFPLPHTTQPLHSCRAMIFPSRYWYMFSYFHTLSSFISGLAQLSHFATLCCIFCRAVKEALTTGLDSFESRIFGVKRPVHPIMS